MKVKKGDTVRLHFQGKLKDGSLFAATEGEEPAEYRVGVDDLIPGIDKALLGMQEGEKKDGGLLLLENWLDVVASVFR